MEPRGGYTAHNAARWRSPKGADYGLRHLSGLRADGYRARSTKIVESGFMRGACSTAESCAGSTVLARWESGFLTA